MDSESINHEGEIDTQADVMRIMISTDNHLGYGEKDAIRGKFLYSHKKAQCGTTKKMTCR